MDTSSTSKKEEVPEVEFLEPFHENDYVGPPGTTIDITIEEVDRMRKRYADTLPSREDHLPGPSDGSPNASNQSETQNASAPNALYQFPFLYSPKHPSLMRKNSIARGRGRARINTSARLPADALANSRIKPATLSYNPTRPPVPPNDIRPHSADLFNVNQNVPLRQPANQATSLLNPAFNPSSMHLNGIFNAIPPMIPQRFAGAPSFTTYRPRQQGLSSAYPRRPTPAHASNVPVTPLQPNALPNVNNMRPVNNAMAPRPNSFMTQAQPVTTALDDFFRQVAQTLPNINLAALKMQMEQDPDKPIQLPVPNGGNSAAMQSLLQDSLERAMLQSLASMPQNIPNRLPNLPNNPSALLRPSSTNDFDTMGAQWSNIGPQQPRKPPTPLPSEDDMAQQDQDVGANQDEEFCEAETYSDYVPTKLKIGVPHPDPVVETSSLSTVEPPDVTYQLNLPRKVIDRGLLSALQLESVIYACQQHEQFLGDDRTRRGFLIGDGAGVGKGRTIAGIIYENYLCGRKKSIWLSVSQDLKLDAERDLKDVGAKRIPVHSLTKFVYGKSINVDAGVVFTTYSGLISKSQTIKGTLGSRMGQLKKWVGADFDGVIVFDECHKAKNLSMNKQKKQSSKAAECALEIQLNLPNARVVYASATGASETKHLGYMVRLGIWGKGTPYGNFVEFCSSIEKRGVGAMELVAVDLKMRGSYIARQLSFKTTSFEIISASLSDDFVKIYDECVELWSKALAHFSEASNLCKSFDNRRSKRLWGVFWGAHQKFFKYLCIGAKVPMVIQMAKQALSDGKSVVIGLQSTGESKTLEALQDDGDITDFVSTARATFESLIENHFPAPYAPKRRRALATSPKQSTSANFLSSSASLASSSSASTVVDESWHNHNMIAFNVQNGLVKPQLKEIDTTNKPHTRSNKKSKVETDTKPGTSKNQKVLDDLLREKRKQRVGKSKSDRARRAKRRAHGSPGARKTRVIMPKDDDDDSTDTDLSSPSSSSIESPNDNSDDTYTDSDDSDTVECSDSSKRSDESVKKTPKGLKAKKPALNSESDSDIEILTVKSRQQSRRPEIIFLDSDEDELDGLDDPDDPDDPITIHGARLSQMRDELLDMIDAIGPRLPCNTLDDLIDSLGGPSKVAEMTGRKGRVVKDEDGCISYRTRNEEDALERLNIAEKERFMSGEKLIAIISEAASMGISLQADKRVQNQRRRVHITIELPWSADRAIQQFGRTHRSNQVSGPEYVFVISKLAGEQRFASVVAKRLESLGALTHGDRRATTDSRDLGQFNIAGRYCKQALDLICRFLERGQGFAGIEPDYPLDKFIQDARDAYVGVGLARMHGNYFALDAPLAVQVNSFLNRLLGMKVRIQNALFKLFTDYMDRLIQRKKVAGLYDSGILELNSMSGKTHCEPPEEFLVRTTLNTIKCTLRQVKVERGISWPEALDLLRDAMPDTRNGFYSSYNPITRAKMIFMVLREPHGIDLFRAYKPNTGRQFKYDYYQSLTDRSTKCSENEAKSLWERIYTITDKNCVHLCFFDSCKRRQAKMNCDVGLRHRRYCIMSGGILTVWPYLESHAPAITTKLQIVRLKLDDQNRVIGPIIAQEHIDQVRTLLKQAEKGIEFR